MDWLEMYCTHCTWTGRTCIVLIVHGLARPVLYPLLTSWPAVGYNPTLGLCDTINPALGFFQSGMELDGINGRTLPDLDDS